MIAKHACSAQCPCQQGREQAIAERVAGRVLDVHLAERVVARYLQSAVEIGRTVFTPQNLKIHRYNDSVEVTDMTNAGKRGKKVQVMHINVGHMAREMANVAMTNLTTEILHMNYGQVKAHVEHIMAKQKAENIYDGFRIDEVTQRGIDIEPMGTKLEVVNKFPNGAWLRINASPHEFHVTDSAVISAPNAAADGFHQDTNYWPVKKQDGILFYGWMKDNLSKVHAMTIQDLTQTWHALGVRYNSH